MQKLKLTRKKIVVGSIVGALILAGGAFVALKVFPIDTKEEEKITSQSADDVALAAKSKIDEGNVSEGLALLDGQIAAERDNEEKVSLLLYKANFATKQGLYDEALDAARQMEVLSPNQPDMFGVYGEVYEGQGNKQRAIEYYEKALNALEGDAMRERFGYKWQARIEELRS